MNESEERRRELLRQTRRLYGEEKGIPLVHPRYGNIRGEYKMEEEELTAGNSFLLRLGIGLLCFACFVWMDHGKVKIADVSSDQITNQIEKQMNLEELEEAWKNL